MNKAGRFLSFLLIFFYSFQALAEYNYDPLLVVVIMVKNEEAVIRATLQPFIDGGLNSFLVLDTGSTDRTIEVTEQFFAENGVTHGYIEQEPFINFSASRNRALDLAQERFPHAAFMVMLDAEWYLNDARALLDFCQLALERGDKENSYLIHIYKNKILDYYTFGLIRCNRGVRFVGVVHEYMSPQDGKAPEHIFFEFVSTYEGDEKSAVRFLRDRELLFREYQKNPLCTRTLFYLARTCEDLGDWEAAYDFYKERVVMPGWDQENFIVAYRLAETIQKLASKKDNTKYTWDEALVYYMRAYEMRPQRIEPLIAIANHYLHIGNMQLAYLFANRAAEIEYPAQDILFVEKYLYTYYRYELLARCAWYINEFEVGEWAARMAYNERPEYSIAQTNMAVYEQRKMCSA